MPKKLTSRIKKLESLARRDAPEVRHLCVSRGPTAVPVAGTMIELTYCPTASRVGEIIRPVKYISKVHLTVPKNATYDRITVRVMTVRSKAGTITAGSMPATVYDCPNNDIYTVLQDRKYEMAAQAWDGLNYSGFPGKSGNWFKSYKRGITAQFDGGTGTSLNGVYFWIIADVAGCNFEGYNEMFYTDL